jgi:outer membrane protein, multidrug efflux system
MKSCTPLVAFLLSAAASAEPMTLRQLIERARTNDPRVMEAKAQLRYFHAKYDEAKWAWFPRIDSYVGMAGPTPEARNDGLGGPPSTRASLMYDLDFSQPGVSMRAGAEGILPLYTFGKLSALEQAGKKGVEAGEALWVSASDEAEYEVSRAYFGYCLAQESREAITDTLRRMDEARDTLKRLRGQASEQVTQLDVYRLDYYRQQAEAQLAAADAGAGFALGAIRLLIGALPGEMVEVSTQRLEEPSGALLPADSYAELALSHRPELRAVAAGVAARENEVFIRERMYLPDFALAGFFRWAWTTSATRQLSPFAYDPYNDLSAGVALVVRYQWDFPQKSIFLEQARAELERSLHQKSLALAGVRLEIDKAWSETSAALVRAQWHATGEKTARRWAAAAFAAFDVGTGETRELVESFTALAMASAQRSQAYHDVQVGLRALSRAVGEPVSLAARKEAPPPSLGVAPAVPQDAPHPKAARAQRARIEQDGGSGEGEARKPAASQEEKVVRAEP